MIQQGVQEIGVFRQLGEFLQKVYYPRHPGLAVWKLPKVEHRLLVRLALALRVECLRQAIRQFPSREEGIRGSLVALVGRASLDALLLRIVLPRVVLALSSGGVQLAPGFFALAGKSAFVFVLVTCHRSLRTTCKPS